MKHKNGFNPLSRNASHLKAMHRNMVTSLFRYERVITTQPKALEVRRTAEKLITRSKVDMKLFLQNCSMKSAHG